MEYRYVKVSYHYTASKALFGAAHTEETAYFNVFGARNDTLCHEKERYEAALNKILTHMKKYEYSCFTDQPILNVHFDNGELLRIFIEPENATKKDPYTVYWFDEKGNRRDSFLNKKATIDRAKLFYTAAMREAQNKEQIA